MRHLGTKVDIKTSTTAERETIVKTVFNNNDINATRNTKEVKPQDTIAGQATLDLLNKYRK